MKPHFKLHMDGTRELKERANSDFDIIERVRRVQIAIGLSQRKFALSIGVDGTRYKNMMAHKCRSASDICIRVCVKYGVHPAWLLCNGHDFNKTPWSIEAWEFVQQYRRCTPDAQVYLTSLSHSLALKSASRAYLSVSQPT